MIQAKCIQKFRDKKGKIIGYRLQDQQGKTIDVPPMQLKNAIKDNQVHVTNLTLTSDNRLIDAKPIKLKQTPTQEFLNKADLLGLNVQGVSTACGNKIYFAFKDQNATLFIPPEVTMIHDKSGNRSEDYEAILPVVKGNIKVIGGQNLITTRNMFFGCKAQSIDLIDFDTSKVTDMYGMFAYCEVPNLDLTSLNTSNVTHMRNMFKSCKAKTINVSSFNTSKVTDMHFMFAYCEAQELDLSNFDTSNVTDMCGMFAECKAQSINISNFDISRVIKRDYMFDKCTANVIKP